VVNFAVVVVIFKNFSHFHYNWFEFLRNICHYFFMNERERESKREESQEIKNIINLRFSIEKVKKKNRKKHPSKIKSV